MANPSTRDGLIDWCKRKLGEPVIEINVDHDQVEDRVDEALQYYQEFHSDSVFRAYLKHQITQTDVDNKYITISNNVLFVSRVFPLVDNSASRNFFDMKYQMHLNDIADLHSYIGDLAYYEQMQQYLSLLDMRLNGTVQSEFTRNQNRLYLFGDFGDGDIKKDDYIVAETYQVIDPTTHTKVFNDMWLKEYTTALIKQQWGSNLIKFEGMTLPGGVMLNGRQLFDDATADIERLREKIRMDHELPPDFFMG